MFTVYSCCQPFRLFQSVPPNITSFRYELDSKRTKNHPQAIATPSICPCSVLNCNRASIDPSGLCLVATQAGRSLFRRSRILPILCTVSSFSVGFDGFDKSGALISNKCRREQCAERHP